METLQLSTHIENNREVSFIVPEEYVNQDVELVVIIQPCEKIKVSAGNRLNEMTQQTIIEARAGDNVAELVAIATDETFPKKTEQTEGEKAYEIMQKSGFIGCVEMDEDLSENYKDHLDWSHKI